MGCGPLAVWRADGGGAWTVSIAGLDLWVVGEDSVCAHMHTRHLGRRTLGPQKERSGDWASGGPRPFLSPN